MSPPSSLSVSDLLARARAEQPGELNRLLEACRNYLQIVARAHVESWLRRKEDASDLIQDTLLEVHRGFKNFRGTTEAEWLAWLRRILANNAANKVRHYRLTAKRQARREVPLAGPTDSSPANDPAAPGDSPSEMLLRKERELLVADALARLSPDHREVILLRNLQRLPFQEVAERMGRSRPAVQMLWMRAIGKLQEELAGGDMSAMFA